MNAHGFVAVEEGVEICKDEGIEGSGLSAERSGRKSEQERDPL